MNGSKSASTVRRIAEAMKPVDAVDYLLGVVEQMEIIKTDRTHPVDGWGIHLTGIERRILVALFDKKGGLSKDAIFNAIYFDRADADDLPDIKIVDVKICNLRKKVPIQTAKIVTIWGHGFRLDVAS